MRYLRLVIFVCVCFFVSDALGYSARVGQVHPDFTLPGIVDGEPVSLSQFRGRKVLLVHFASWWSGCRRAVPVWNEKTRKWVEEGKLVVVGIAQEQHRNRCRLFAQWHRMDWPILHDPINLMRVRGVPIEVAIDEYGIVRSTKPDLKTLEEEFINKSFKGASSEAVKATKPDLKALRQRAEKGGSGDAWRELADALLLWGGAGGIDEAITAYTKAIELKPDDGDSHFRLGVCYRMRYESADGRGSDFQAAVDSWSKARQIDPNQYIWRRRIEQYGPRLSKPYPFYDWMAKASHQVRARGDEPVEIEVLPGGSEIAGPAREFGAEAGKANKGMPPA